MNNFLKWIGLSWFFDDGASCEHKWELVAKTYAPALSNLQTLQFDVEILQKVLFGVTSYMWECNHCGSVHKEELLGSDENQLTDILDKANKFGIQYVKHDGQSFGVARVPSVTPVNIPVGTPQSVNQQITSPIPLRQ